MERGQLVDKQQRSVVAVVVGVTVAIVTIGAPEGFGVKRPMTCGYPALGVMSHCCTALLLYTVVSRHPPKRAYYQR